MFTGDFIAMKLIGNIYMIVRTLVLAVAIISVAQAKPIITGTSIKIYTAF